MKKKDTPSTESSHYADVGASSSKGGVHAAVGYRAGRMHFTELFPDAAGDREFRSLVHADGAGTKSIVAYLAYRESNDPSWFRTLAIDSLAMNLDDVACVGAFAGLQLSNTITRNRSLVSDDCVAAIVAEYKKTVERLADQGIEITLTGGETADAGDLVRTVVIDSSLFARVHTSRIVSFERVSDGDCIVGFSSTGKAQGEQETNSGIGSNGLSLARHALIAARYREKYPEIVDPNLPTEKTYRGKHGLFDSPPPLSQNIARALLSPTRIYAPLIRELTEELKEDLHGVIHCTGGGQTKIINFGRGKRYVKESLFPTPPIFSLIQSTINVPWREMYAVFNMGHRLEILCNREAVKNVIQLAKGYGIEARQIGSVEEIRGARNEVIISCENGNFEY